MDFNGCSEYIASLSREFRVHRYPQLGPDGVHLVSEGRQLSQGAGGVVIFNPEDPSQLASPSYAYNHEKGSVMLLSLADGQCQKFTHVHPGDVNSVAVSPDGKKLDSATSLSPPPLPSSSLPPSLIALHV